MRRQHNFRQLLSHLLGWRILLPHQWAISLVFPNSRWTNIGLEYIGLNCIYDISEVVYLYSGIGEEEGSLHGLDDSLDEIAIQLQEICLAGAGKYYLLIQYSRYEVSECMQWAVLEFPLSLPHNLGRLHYLVEGAYVCFVDFHGDYHLAHHPRCFPFCFLTIHSGYLGLGLALNLGRLTLGLRLYLRLQLFAFELLLFFCQAFSHPLLLSPPPNIELSLCSSLLSSDYPLLLLLLPQILYSLLFSELQLAGITYLLLGECSLHNPYQTTHLSTVYRFYFNFLKHPDQGDLTELCKVDQSRIIYPCTQLEICSHLHQPQVAIVLLDELYAHHVMSGSLHIHHCRQIDLYYYNTAIVQHLLPIYHMQIMCFLQFVPCSPYYFIQSSQSTRSPFPTEGFTFLSAQAKSYIVSGTVTYFQKSDIHFASPSFLPRPPSFLSFLRIGMQAASLHKFVISAPLIPSVFFTISYISSWSVDTFLRFIFNSYLLPISVGSGIYILFWRRLLIAQSRSHGLFVAPITTSCFIYSPEEAPSMHVINYVFTFLLDQSYRSPLFEASASIQSMKIVAGAQNWAISNRIRTNFSLYPFHFDANEDAVTLKKVVLPLDAIALANSVFPVPGGPNSKTPFQAFLIPVNSWGMANGSNTASSKTSLAFCNQAISSKVIFGLKSMTSFSNISIRLLSGPFPSGYLAFRNDFFSSSLPGFTIAALFSQGLLYPPLPLFTPL